jgi:two-component system NtrC family sensor kinase
MSRDSPSRRLISTAEQVLSVVADDPSAPVVRPLISLLAQSSRLVDLLPRLHQHALDATGGSSSLLFEHNPRNSGLQATSGFGLDQLRPEPWGGSPIEQAIVTEAFDRHRPRFIADAGRQMPDLAVRLGVESGALLLLPLLREGRRIGLFVIGFRATVGGEHDWDWTAELADGVVTTLELFRFRQNEDFQHQLRELLRDVTTSLATSLNLAAALDIFCDRGNRLFGAERTAVWLHDRRLRHISIKSSSLAEQVVHGAPVDVDDALAPAALALRSLRAEIQARPDGESSATLTVPLRGYRRALGAVVFDGVRIEVGGELDLLDRADELGIQLSAIIENMQLLDDVTRSRRELENTFDSIAHLVVVTDQRGAIVHANQAFASRIGLKREELIDQSLARHIGPELATWLETQHREGGNRRQLPAASIEILDPVLKGSFMVTVTDLLDYGRERVGRVLVARDLTPQWTLEAEREELRKRLTQSEKLAALGQFVAGIAHELNNPLQGVLGHLELLRATGAFPKPLKREMQTIYREADRAAKIVRNLLVFAGSRRLVNRAVSLTAVLQKVLALRVPACRALDIEVVRHYDEKLPRVQSDPLLLHQVFLNIVMNAEQAIAEGGAPGRIEVAAAFDPAIGRIVATVRDTGHGIPEDALTRIFEPFYTTKEVGKGTGLGLAIVYGIMQEHGGHIAATNHPEGGAVFTVELPAYPKRSAA